MKKIWKLCGRLKFFKLANALSYANASEHGWKMLPILIPPGVTSNKVQSFVNGWYTKYPIGWIEELDNPFLDSDPELENWDVKFDFGPNTDITVRPRF